MLFSLTGLGDKTTASFYHVLYKRGAFFVVSKNKRLCLGDCHLDVRDTPSKHKKT